MNGGRLATGVAMALMVAIATMAHRVVQRFGAPELDLAGRATSTLSADSRSFLDELDERVSVTFFVSGRSTMPSHLKVVEPTVRRLLEAMRRRAPEWIDVRVLDPGLGGEAGAAYAARRKVSPIKVRRVVEDATGEQEVWSSLALRTASGGEALIQGIQDTDLPLLQGLIVEHLRALRDPPRPVFALAAPADGYRGLAAALAEHGPVIELDLERRPDVPLTADVLFWMQPDRVSDAAVAALRRYIDGGRTVVLAGSTHTIEYVLDEDGAIRFRVRRHGDGWSRLLAELGLEAAPDLLLDRASGPVLVRTGTADATGEPASAAGLREVAAPFQLRCLPAFYDMRSFHGPARGALHFVAAAPLAAEPRRLEELGMSAEVVATTTEHARVLPLPEGLFDVEDLEGGLPVPKQNLAVLLEPDSPWRGQVLVLASSSLFEDGIFQEDGFAHRVFLRTLLRTFEDRSRLVRNRVERPMPPPLPALGDGARLLWRGAVVLSVPVLLLIGLAVRGRRRGGAVRGDVTVSAIWRAGSQVLVAGGVALVLLLMLAHYLSPLAAVRLDLTADRLHTPAPATLAALAAAERPGGATAVPAPASRAAASDGLRVVLVASPRATLPPELKPIEPRVRRLLRDAGIETSVRRPSTLAAGEPEALARLGLGPFQIQTVVGDSLVPRTVWCGLLLERGARRSVVPHLDGRTVRHLEFLLAAAALRLRDGRAPRVAVLSDLPRLSPAEAYEDYQKQGLIAPAGTDVYSRLRRLLADYGYRVIHLDPREPVLPDDVDVLVWMQPRRDASAPRRLLAGHLAAGGRALVALQHFNIQQRQYRGAGFETVYWPQPQFQDLDLYLRQLGVEQVREVLMDRTRADLELETEVRRTAVREYDPQQVALPFLIRAVGTDYAAGSTITRNLGDLLFIWGNRFALDRERLAALDLEATILVTTSPTAWSYDWHGGWLPPEVFEPGDSLLGRCPLVVRLRGRFPPVVPRTAASGPDDLELRTAVPDGDASAPRGDLVLVGCSEMFKNAHLERAGFAHDQLLLNTVATLALPTELAALMNRHPVVRGFPRRSPSTVLGWRLAVVAGGPLALGLLGLGRWRRGRRPPSVAAPRAAPRSAAASTVGDAGRPRGAS